MIQFDWRIFQIGLKPPCSFLFLNVVGQWGEDIFFVKYIYIYPFRSFFHEVESPLLLGFFVSKSCCGLRQFLAPHPTWRLVVLRGSEQTLLQPAEGWGHLFERVCFPTELTAKGSFKRGNPPIGTCSFSHCPDANLCFSDMCRRIAQKQLGAKSLPCHKSTSTSQWVN